MIGVAGSPSSTAMASVARPPFTVAPALNEKESSVCETPSYVCCAGSMAAANTDVAVWSVTAREVVPSDLVVVFGVTVTAVPDWTNGAA